MELLHPCFSLLVFFSITVFAQNINRVNDPIIYKGSQLTSCFVSANPSDIVAFSYSPTGWQQIPLQIDEMEVVDVVACYGPHAVTAGFPPPTGYSILAYSDAGTYIGADTDISFDADDELVFMALDAGLQAPPLVPQPVGVTSANCCELQVTDPIDGNIAYVYLFLQDGSLQQDAGMDLVSYSFALASGGSYPTNYNFFGFEAENSSITTAAYQHYFSSRWVNEQLSNSTSGSSNTDILNRHQSYFAPGVCVRSEDTFSNGEGCFLTIKDGPLRAIRSYMGANSGPLTQRTHLFYESRHDIITDLRVHSISSIYDCFDYETTAPGMKYYNNLNTGGLDIDGLPEPCNLGLVEWELVEGSHGSLSIIHDLETDLNLTTEATVSSYWEDDAANSIANCTGDGLAIGNSGLAITFINSNVCTDPVLTNCGYASPNFRELKAKRILYYESPGQGVADATLKHNQYENPLLLATNACSICWVNLNLTDPNDTYVNGDNVHLQVSNKIEGSNTVQLGATAIYDAKICVELHPNFNIEQGAQFEVTMTGCN